MKPANKVYLQHDNEKPILIPVNNPDKLPSNGIVNIKGKEYRIFTVEIEQATDIFWNKKRGLGDSSGGNRDKLSARDKIKRNLQIFKETGKYPKD